MALQRRQTIGIPTDGFSSLWTILFWAGLLAAGGYGVYWCIGALKAKADSEVEKNAPEASAKLKKGPRSTTPPPAFIPARQAKPELDRAAAEVNLLILQKEAARLRDDGVTQAQHARTAMVARSRFLQMAEGESPVPELLDPNDEISGIDDVDFSRLPAEGASRYITQTISKIPAGTYMKIRVKRPVGGKDVILYFGTASGTGAMTSMPGRMKITAQFAQEIQRQVLALPPDQLTDFDRRQIERVLGAGEASDEEYQMLVRRLGGAAAYADATAARGESFTRQIKRLEAFLPKAPVPEAILTKDGRKFSGKLLQDTPGAVSVRTVVGDITIPKEDVSQLLTADNLRAEFASKYGAGEKYKDALFQLLVWTREMNMPVHREYVAYTILQTSPSDPFARNAAGYVQADGQWVLKNSIAAGAPIPEKKAESRNEIQQELESMGFVLRDNHWFSKVPWSVGIDSLFKPYPLKIGMNGTQIVDWYEGDTPIARIDGKLTKNGPPNLKFIAPTAGQGLATVAVEAPGEILECQVKAFGGVIDERPGTRAECWLTAEGGRTEVLWDTSSKPNFNFRDVTLYVRGKKKFSVTARLTTIQDKYHMYARFLSSNKDTTEIFWVKGVVLKPAFEFDRVWANAK